MNHHRSSEDLAFRQAFESGQLSLAQFDHRGHLRLAYTFLAELDTDAAVERMRSALKQFLSTHGIPAEKFHETLTRSWILAVRHFMAQPPEADSADTFIAAHPQLLDRSVMLSHYSAALLFSPEARSTFVEPDTSPIPRY